MASMLFEIAVELEGGETYVVVADQRDIARWEVQPFGCPFSEFESRSMAFMRFLAWSAATRQQLTTLPWVEYDERLIEAIPVPDEESAVANDAEDPGQPVP